jgi:hypothetical protein
MKKRKLKKPKLGLEVALVSQRNRVFKDRKKEASRLKCRVKRKVTLIDESQ